MDQAPNQPTGEACEPNAIEIGDSGVAADRGQEAQIAVAEHRGTRFAIHSPLQQPPDECTLLLGNGRVADALALADKAAIGVPFEDIEPWVVPVHALANAFLGRFDAAMAAAERGFDPSFGKTNEVSTAVNWAPSAMCMVALGRGVKEAQLKSGIERLVDLSGGRLLFVERSEQLDEPFADILQELSNQYMIGFESKNPKRDGAWRELKLEIPGTNYLVRARQGYRAPGS